MKCALRQFLWRCVALSAVVGGLDLLSKRKVVAQNELDAKYFPAKQSPLVALCRTVAHRSVARFDSLPPVIANPYSYAAAYLLDEMRRPKVPERDYVVVVR